MIYRLLTLFWLTCLVGVLWLAALTPPAQHYELTLIDAFPRVLWALLLCATLAAVTILVILVLRQQVSKWWVSGLLGIVATNALVTLLQLYRDYPINDREDALLQFGWLRETVAAGTISPDDFYPAHHLLQLPVLFSGIMGQGDVFTVTAVIFALLWVIGPVMLVRQLTGNELASYLAAAFSAVMALVAFHRFDLPNIRAITLIPFLLTLHLKRSQAGGEQNLAIVIGELFLSFLLVFLHPVTTFYLIVMLIAFQVGSRLYRVLQRRFPFYVPSSGVSFHLSAELIPILTVTLITWALSFPEIASNITSLVRFLLGKNDETSSLGDALGQVQTAQLPILELARILLNQFGTPVILVGLAAVLMGTLAVISRRKRSLPPDAHWILMVGFIAMAGVAAFMFLVSSAERGPLRLLRMLALMSLWIIPWWSWEVVFARVRLPYWPRLPDWRRPAAALLVLVTLYVLVPLSQMNLYPSPLNGTPNEQPTRNEISALGWLLENRVEGTDQAGIVPGYVLRFMAYYWGHLGRQTKWPTWFAEEIWLPTHFYAPQWNCLAEVNAKQNTYLFFTIAAQISPLRFPESVRERAHLYTDKDWQGLYRDASVSKIYDNGDSEIWETNKDLAGEPTLCSRARSAVQ